jgi:hypothetical protein
MADVSAIFIQRGPPPARKQTDLCLKYTHDHRLPMIAIVPHWAAQDAVRMVKAGAVNTIVTAFDSRVARQLAEDLDGDGCVIYVHPVPTTIPRRSTLPALSDLIRRWHRAGRTPRQIARDIGSETTDVSEVLRRMDDGASG